MPNKMVSLQIQNVLYVPEANKQLFLLIATGQHGSMSQTMSKGTTISLNGKLYIIGLPKSGRLHSFDMELIKNKNEIPRAIIATISDYTLWHRRMGHAHQCVINILEKTQKEVLTKPLMHLKEPVRDVKKGNPRDSLSQLWNQGQTTTWFGSFQSGWNASSLHWWIQVYCHIYRRLFILWGHVLPQKEKWWIHCIQAI